MKVEVTRLSREFMACYLLPTQGKESEKQAEKK